MKNNIWQLQDAKSKFSQLVDHAMNNNPQFVTKHGKNAVVIVSFDDYKKMNNPSQDLVTFFKNSPLSTIQLTLERSKETPREIDL